MSLNVDHSKVSPPVTESDTSVFNVGITLVVLGVPKLDTVSDMHEILVRARFYEAFHGYLLGNDKGESLSSKKAFWERWTGINVNGVKESRAVWIKRMTKQAIQEIDWAVSKEL